MSNYTDSRFRPIRKALHKLFPEAVPDWVVALVNGLPDNLSDDAIGAIAAEIENLAHELGGHLKQMAERLTALLTMGGTIAPPKGNTPGRKGSKPK